jgi:hypothetical protein
MRHHFGHVLVKVILRTTGDLIVWLDDVVIFDYIVSIEAMVTSLSKGKRYQTNSHKA